MSEVWPSQLWLRKGTPPLLRHDQFQYRLLHVWPVLSGVALGDGHGWLIACGNGRTAECNAGGVEMMAAQGDACVGPDLQRTLLKQEVAAIGVGLIERVAERQAVAHVGAHAGSPQPIEGFARKKLWGQR